MLRFGENVASELSYPSFLTDRPAGGTVHARPRVILFDVNETLSDMSPLQERFSAVGAAPHLAALWFAGVLRDGFALTAAGDRAVFGQIATDALRRQLTGQPLTRDRDDAVSHIMAGFAGLDLHPDVSPGIHALGEAGLRLATLSNGAAQVAETLLARAGVRGDFERLLSVDDAGAWKPARTAYDYAAHTLAVAPQDVMLVAVHPWDIHGAARAGLQTAWLHRTPDADPSLAYPAYFEAPGVTIRSLGELVGRLPAAASPA